MSTSNHSLPGNGGETRLSEVGTVRASASLIATVGFTRLDPFACGPMAG